MKLLLVARDLSTGGAQRQLVTASSVLRDRGHQPVAAALYGGGDLTPELEGSGARVHSLEKEGRWDLWRPLRRLRALVRRERPDLYVGYQELPNAMGALLAPWIPAPVVWGVWDSGTRPGQYDWTYRALRGANRLLARVPAAVVFNSEAGRRRYTSGLGVPADRSVVVPNGVDTDRFRPDEDERRRQREAWGVTPGETLVGVVGRLHPKKGHGDFLRAAGEVARRREDVRFAVVGRDYGGRRREELRREAGAAGIADSVIWEGARARIRPVYAALDVCVLPSRWGEGWPNVVGEAMACGTPCVVTEVGDAARIVGEAGLGVPAGDPSALAEGCRRILALGPGERQELGERARERIVSEYGMERHGERLEAALADAAGTREAS